MVLLYPSMHILLHYLPISVHPIIISSNQSVVTMIKMNIIPIRIIPLISIAIHYSTAVGFSIVLWDVSTLVLYMIKIWSFKKYETEEPNVYKRIMSIFLSNGVSTDDDS